MPHDTGMARHPDPPANLAALALPVAMSRGPWHRLHPLTYGPIFFGKRRLNRFDDPERAFGVLYVALEIDGAFLETFGRELGRRYVSMSQLRSTGYAMVGARRALRLVDLTGPGLARIGADASLCTGRDLEVTKRWSRAFYLHPDLPDGILYRMRHDPSQVGIAVFDRAEQEMEAAPQGTLADLAKRLLLERILDEYDFGLGDE